MELFVSPSARERRLVLRREVRTPLRIRVCKSNGPEREAESVNLSEHGVYFTMDSPLREGEVIEVFLRMPEEVIGDEADEWKCTGRVVRVERSRSSPGKLGFGVRFDCYEVSRGEQRRMAKEAKLRQRVTVPMAP